MQLCRMAAMRLLFHTANKKNDMNNKEIIELVKSVARGETAAADATWKLKGEKIGIVYSAYLNNYDNKRELIFARAGWKNGKETVLPCHFSTLLYAIENGITIKADTTRYRVMPCMQEESITITFNNKEV